MLLPIKKSVHSGVLEMVKQIDDLHIAHVVKLQSGL